MSFLIFFFVLIRVSSIVAFFPFVGEATIPIQIKVMLSLLLSAVFFPLAIHFDNAFVVSTVSSEIKILLAIGMEVTLGLAIGLLARLSFYTVLTAGHFIAAQMGMTMASVFDPTIGQRSDTVQRFLYLIAMMIFLTINGHYLLFQVIKETFIKIPPASLTIGPEFAELLNVGVQSVFVWAIKLAAPVLIVTMAMNAGMGLVARAVPQMNVMMVAFALNILVGLIVLFVSLPVLMDSFEVIMVQVHNRVLGAINVL